MDAIIFSLKVCITDYTNLFATLAEWEVQVNFAAENCQIAAMGFVKASLLLFYRRIFWVSRSFVIASNVLLAVLTSFTLAVLLV